MRSQGDITRRRVLLALASGSALVAAGALAGCTANDPLAGQATAPEDKNYVSGEGSVTEYSADQRPDPVEFDGVSVDGGSIGSADLAGAVAVLNFWYAACPPCRAEAPDLKALYEQYSAQGVRFLGVNVRDSADTARAFDERFGLEYPSILDAQASGQGVQTAFVAARIAPTQVPSTLVLGRDGRITARILGQLDKSILSTLIQSALAEQPTAQG